MNRALRAQRVVRCDLGCRRVSSLAADVHVGVHEPVSREFSITQSTAEKHHRVSRRDEERGFGRVSGFGIE